MKGLVRGNMKTGDSAGFFWTRARSELISGLVEGKEIIDVGCGNGMQAITLAKKGHNVTGIDIYGPSIEEARKNAAARGADVKFSRGRVEELEHAFDTVLLLDVLEHIKNDARFLKGLKRIVRPNGVLVITVPAYMFLWGGWDEENEHYRRYSMRMLRAYVEKAGFKVEMLRYWNLMMFVPALLFSRILRKLYPISEFSRSVLNRVVLAWFTAFENKCVFPAGVSIVLKARKSAETRTVPG